jgi:type II restriction/modification system DNA methylase subunit YeeA
LEQLKIDLLGTEVETDELVENKKQSKRKKDGIFYTPEYIVDYIVQNSLMKYLSEKEDACLAKYKDEQKAYQAYQQILQNVKVLDPACGSGAFLVKVFDVLYAENQRVGKLIGALFDESNTYKNILTNNIYGVDLNPESVEITKLSLWLKSAQKGKKLNNLDTNIKCGNSLIDDPAVAGERAFDWHKEFASIMAAG